ncbi:MAG: peptidoglycan-binding protein [Candidatus Sungbacteria bacterium]|nr:peptidoglycan-binding protein [Candidatus Sungbacteria bacterium]
MNIKSKDGGSIKAKIFAFATAITFSGAVAFIPMAAVADHTTAHTIEQLTAQIAALQAQLLILAGGTTPPSGGATACTFTKDLTLGSTGDDVMCLQKYLNGAGFQVSASGAGSPGNETSYFGTRTKAAVSAWQSANGVSPTAGYFGAISRAKYAAIGGTAPAPAPTPTPPPADGTPPPAPVGSGLTVAAAGSQPEASLAPLAAARIPFTKAVFTASSDGDVTVKSVTAERKGLADDDAFDSVILLDENGIQVGLSKTLNANHQVLLNEAFVVKAGTSREMTIAANMVSTSGSNAGQVAYFAIVAVDAGTSTVNGTFPIQGNGQTINESLSIGTLVSPTQGVLDPGAARSSLEVGTTKFFASGVRWSVGSAEPVILEQVRWYQSGSAASGDIKNIKVTVKDVDYDATVSSDGKYYTAKFSPGVEFDKGATIDFGIKIDVDSGSDRTVDFDILRRTDVVVKGKTFGYYIIPANGSSDPTDDSGAFSSGEPYYDANQHTIAKGSLRLEKSNMVPSGNTSVDVSNVNLGAVALEAKGEPVQISSFKVSFVLSAGEDGTQMDSVSIVDKNGAVVAGPKDVDANEQVTFSDTWTVPVGYQEYYIRGKLTTDFEEGDTIQGSVDPDGDITAKGESTGLTITASPTASTTFSTMTVRRAALSVSMSNSPSAQNVVRGINGFLFAKVQFDGGSSGEDLRITKQELTVTTSSNADMDDLNNCQMFDGATALNTGSNVVNPSGNAAGADAEISFTLDNNLVVPKGTVKLVDVKCNISSNATNGETWSIGIADTNDDTTVVGKDTATTVTETVTVNVGPTMTIRSGGTMAVALDSSSPSERFAIFGKTDQTASVFKLTSTYENQRITKFGFNMATGTASTSDVTKVTFWDGATKVGEGVFTGTNALATSTFSGDFVVPKDSDKLLTAKVDIIPLANSSVGKTGHLGGEDSGHLMVINWDGARTTATEAVGADSGSTINTSAGSHTAANGMRLVRTYPTVARLAVPTNTLSSGDMALYRFSVTADASGDVGLYMVRFRVSTQVPMSATTSSYRLFAYTDSGFSTAAYAQNPVNTNDVDCVGSSSLETGGANDTCSANDNNNDSLTSSSKYANAAASSSRVTILFDPSTNTPSNPNAEAINIPAGATRYFSLVANVSATTTDTISVALLGDATSRARTDRSTASLALGDAGAAGTPSEENSTALLSDTLWIADRIATSSNFTWSPNTTTTSATTTNDWLTGYLVPGLPSTELGQQTFTK